MPSIHDDVRYDESTTFELIRQLGACREAIDDARAWLAGDRAAVTDDWRGPHRQRFDDDLAALQVRLGGAVDDLEASARRAVACLAEAEAEQSRRRRLRAVDAAGAGGG